MCYRVLRNWGTPQKWHRSSVKWAAPTGWEVAWKLLLCWPGGAQGSLWHTRCHSKGSGQRGTKERTHRGSFCNNYGRRAFGKNLSLISSKTAPKWNSHSKLIYSGYQYAYQERWGTVSEHRILNCNIVIFLAIQKSRPVLKPFQLLGLPRSNMLHTLKLP